MKDGKPELQLNIKTKTNKPKEELCNLNVDTMISKLFKNTCIRVQSSIQMATVVKVWKDDWDSEWQLRRKGKILKWHWRPNPSIRGYSQLLCADVKAGWWRTLTGRKYSIQIWCCRSALQIPKAASKTNNWVLDQIKQALMLKAKTIKLRPTYFSTQWDYMAH